MKENRWDTGETGHNILMVELERLSVTEGFTQSGLSRTRPKSGWENMGSFLLLMPRAIL